MADTSGSTPGLLVLLAQALEARESASPAAAYFTVPEAAKMLKLCEDTIRRRIRTKQMPAIRVGRDYRIPASYFDGLAVSALVSAS